MATDPHTHPAYDAHADKIRVGKPERVMPEPDYDANAAPTFCRRAADLMTDRGKERDQANGERSMARCVNTFNTMTGHELTTEEGWLFMVYLKHSRMRGGGFKLDDYEDAVAYEALMAEEAANAQY